MAGAASGEPDVRFWFDPTCPFAWLTSRWVRTVQEQRSYDVEWRFISLRLVNRDVDYAAHFPPEYEDGHTSGCTCCGSARRSATTTALTRWPGSTRRSDGGSSTTADGNARDRPEPARSRPRR